jgi:hypothetical protein
MRIKIFAAPFVPKQAKRGGIVKEKKIQKTL